MTRSETFRLVRLSAIENGLDKRWGKWRGLYWTRRKPTQIKRLRSGERAGFMRRLAQFDTGASDHDAAKVQ